MSNQLTLTLDPGLSARHRDLRDCLAAGVYPRGLTRVAGQIDLSPSKLSEKLSGGNGDRSRDIGLAEFERYLDSTGDLTPVHYLVDKYLRDPSLQQAEAIARVAQLTEQLTAVMQAAGLSMQGPARRGKR